MLSTSAVDVRSLTGGYLNAVALGTLPGVADAMTALLDRIQALAFVPADWRSNVLALMGETGGARTWQPAYAIETSAWTAGKTNPVYPGIPSWLADDANARVAWNTVCDWWTRTLTPILAGWSRDEAATWRAAANDAAFWDHLYNFVEPIAKVGQILLDAPVKVAEAATTVTLGVIGKLVPVIAVVAVLAIAAIVIKGKLTSK